MFTVLSTIFGIFTLVLIAAGLVWVSEQISMHMNNVNDQDCNEIVDIFN